MTDLASLMADEPEQHFEPLIRNEFRAKVRPHLAEQEAREQALLAERDAAEESRRFYMAERDRLRARVAELEAYVRSLKEPTFRDYSDTDYDTCAWCGQPVEAYPHADDCLWLKRIDVLARATLEGGTE